ncbi:isochorismate synthase [Pantanalinema sp. GBBB05]|uniref:isochorismate synthase n=1 Tax=Pantanalinema sp. GBBB05 TaxID=2604139 RepID=UPI001D3A40B3|nr:isochorismate synthase [Pantanalinema sp. GBBB05]
MTVTPYCNTLFQSRKNLHQFLSACQQELDEKSSSQIISISWQIDSVDPLTVLHKFSQSDQLSFYFEKQELGTEIHSRESGFAIAAIGAVAQLQINHSNRFVEAQTFIQSTLSQTTIIGDTHLPLTGPHFFCSFAFFDDASSQSSGFPATTVFLPAWQVSQQKNHCTIVANLRLDAESDLELTIDQLWSQLQAIRSIKYELTTPLIEHRTLLKIHDVTDTHHFKQAVLSALNQIAINELNKVVLAHAVDVSSPVPFHLANSLYHLRHLYPDCYLFSISNGQGQTFIGASPERLIQLSDRHLVTDALAGSAARGRTTFEDAHFADSLLNSAKEMHEHQVVIDFITGRLIQLGLKPQRSPLRLLQLSNIQHLQTPIHASVPAHVHLLDIVAELHPTPAVAGVPRDIACNIIREHEMFERSLYAAPIGWVDHQGNGEFAVGIRSALINGQEARLYAGAGIVSGSDPDRELAEIQLKLQALLNALV